MRALIAPALLCTIISTAFPAAAQTLAHRTSLGIEVPVLSIDSRSVSSVSTTSTNMGVFGNGGGLNGQYGLSNSSVLGLRLAFSRQTVSDAAQSQLSLLPRFEYYAAQERPVRPHIGIEAGVSRITSKGGPAITEFSIGPTGGVAYFPSDKWELDFNASLFLGTGSESMSGASVGMSGYGFIVRVNLATWFGNGAANADAAPAASPSNAAMAPALQVNAAPAATAPPTTAEPAAAAPVGVATSNTTTNAGEPSASDIPPVESSRLTVELREGRRLSLVATPVGAEKRVKFILVKAPVDESLKNCSTVEFHAPKQLTALAVRYKQLSTASGEVSTLSAEISAETLKSLTSALVAGKQQAAPDYWIGVCGKNWQLNSRDRGQLKEYLDSL